MTISSISAPTPIRSSSTISSALTSAYKGLPLPGASATSTNIRGEIMTTSSTSPLKSTRTKIPSAGTRSSAPSLTSTTNQQEVVNPSSAPADTSHSSGEPSVHVVHSITVVTPTSTSTITQFPESTFSTPVVVTTVQDGTTSVGTPALMTLISTSTNSDGLSVTWTHVDANPPTVTAMRAKSFLHNTGAVAGVSALVGVIVACFLLGILYLLRRFYRTRRRRRILASLPSLAPGHNPEYGNPFNDNGAEPVMHSLSYGITVSVPETSRPADIISPSFKTALFNAHRKSTSTEQLNSVQQMNPCGTDLDQITPQSTPSIYPATLPPEDETAIDQRPVEQSNIYMQQEAESAKRNAVPVKSLVVLRERPHTADEPPPRPPRSVLRTRSAKTASQHVSWKSWSPT